MRVVFIVFLCMSLSGLFASEENVIGGSVSFNPIKTTFHIFPSYLVVSATANEMEHQEIAASAKFYGRTGALGGAIAGGGLLGTAFVAAAPI